MNAKVGGREVRRLAANVLNVMFHKDRGVQSKGKMLFLNFLIKQSRTHYD